jgi:hypothetical protein
MKIPHYYISKKKRKILTYFCYGILFFGVERWCFLQTGGFRDSNILSSCENVSSATPIPLEKKKLIDKVLNQPFHYIDQGSTCYCFGSEDGLYVIKFFKHQHFTETSLLSSLPLPSFLNEYREKLTKKNRIKNKYKDRDYLFTSAQIAENLLSEDTGIIHIQLSKNPEFARSLVLYDKIGVIHKIPLDQTEFIVQKKAEKFFPTLLTLVQNNKIEEAKKGIDSLFANIERRCSLGIADRDPHVSINYGFINGEAIEIDIGSFTIDETLKSPANKKKVIQSIGLSLKKRLVRDKAYTLDAYVDEKLQSL